MISLISVKAIIQYAVILASNLLLNVAGAVSPQLRHQLTWSRTVNTRGGRHNNVPKDLHNEHLNRQYKTSSKVSIGQLTDTTIHRHSQLIVLNLSLINFFRRILL